MPLFSCIPLGCRGGVDVIDRIQCGLDEVPPEVDRSTHTLEELYLDCNQISEISEKLARCRKLRTLSLGQNKLLRVPSFIGLLKTLEELHLEDNELTDLPSELEDCTNLQVLDLRLNLFLRLPDVVPRLESLTQLHLFETSLTQLPADIGCLRNLRYLDVRENQLRVLPPAICDLTNLKQLDVGRNELLLLPMGLGVLENLEELYADHNLLNAIPDSLVNCHLLKVLDISENDILSLPEELGDLAELCELNISENRITSLPNSMSRLKKLTTFKADSNGIAILTTAIGGCVTLHEMYLANNQLTCIPSALGNLEALTLLTLDENRLTEIPSTIGGCRKLSILTLRNNQLQDLPFEVGRLENLNVLDLCDNQLMFLPYTITVLTNLKALWLSVDQTVPRVPLTVALDPVTHVKVLTCYLLPQGMGQEAATRQRRTDGNVHFGEEGEEDGDEDSEQNRFIRRGTPHPKPRSRVALRRQSIDGHLIPHNKEENKLDQTLLLRRKSMGDTPNPTIAKLSSTEFPANNIFEPPERSATSHEESPKEPLSSDKDHDNSTVKKHCITIKRDEKSGLGLTIAGGCDSDAKFKEGDDGLFISKVLEGGAAQTAGLLSGDKIISVNGTSVINAKHQVAVELMQKEDPLILTVLREHLSASLPIFGEVPELNDTEDNENGDSHIETVSTTVQRDMDGSLGFCFEVLVSGIEKSLVVTSIKGDGTKLRIGDRIVSINGKNVSSMNVEDGKKILAEDGGKEAYLIVQRKNASHSGETSVNNVSLAQDDVVLEPEQNNNLNVSESRSVFPSSDVINEKERSSPAAEELTPNQEEQQTEKMKILLNGRKAPPVAPKPKGYKIFNNAAQQGENEDVVGAPEPSALTFSSKLKKFESVSQVPSPRNTDSNGLPAKKPLISREDILRLKEDAGKRTVSATEALPLSPDDSVTSSTFDEFIEKRSCTRNLPSVVRTKKAELRMERASPTLSESHENGEELAIDLEKRQQWRQARYKSLEVGAARSDSVMEQVREIKCRSGMIAEEPASSPMSSNGDVTNNNGEQAFTDPADDCTERLLNRSATNGATLGVSL